MRLGVGQMADWAKIILKSGLIAGVMIGLWAVFTQIQIPSIDYTVVTQTAGTAMAFLTYWCPAFPIIWNISLVMLGILVALWTFRFGSIAVRWLFKVNE